MTSKATTEKRAFSVPKASAMLDISTASGWNAVWSGRIRSIRIGGRVLIPATEIERLLNEGTETSEVRA